MTLINFQKLGRDSRTGQSPTYYHFSPLYPQNWFLCMTRGNFRLYDLYINIKIYYDKRYDKMSGKIGVFLSLCSTSEGE